MADALNLEIPTAVPTRDVDPLFAHATLVIDDKMT